MQWVAYYNDGTHLRQYEDDGGEHKYADLDRQRLASFALYDGGDIDGNYVPATRKLFHLHLEPGQRLIFRRRVEQTLGQPPISVFMIGWQQALEIHGPTLDGNANGHYPKNIQAIAYIFEDGTIELAGRWREDHPWFYSVQAVPSEESDVIPS